MLLGAQHYNHMILLSNDLRAFYLQGQTLSNSKLLSKRCTGLNGPRKQTQVDTVLDYKSFLWSTASALSYRWSVNDGNKQQETHSQGLVCLHLLLVIEDQSPNITFEMGLADRSVGYSIQSDQELRKYLTKNVQMQQIIWEIDSM